MDEKGEKSAMAMAMAELSNQFKALISTHDIESLKQHQMLMQVSSDFSASPRLLKSMKSDLDYSFLKLRGIKGRILATYPDAFPDESSRKELDERPDLELPQ